MKTYCQICGRLSKSYRKLAPFHTVCSECESKINSIVAGVDVSEYCFICNHADEYFELVRNRKFCRSCFVEYTKRFVEAEIVMHNKIITQMKQEYEDHTFLMTAENPS